MRTTPSRFLLPALLAGACATVVPAQNRIILPPGFDTVEGISSHTYPWGVAGSHSNLGCRVQMIYDSSYFTAQGWNAAFPITRLRWRADGLSGSPTTGGTYAMATIDMSTAPVDHRQASRTFDANHGGDRTTVFTGSVTLLPTPSQIPNIFYIDLTLTNPFPYDPRRGDLVIDVALPFGWSGGTAARTDVESGGAFGRVVEATMVMNQVASTAVSGSVLNDVAHIVTIDFGGARQATAGTYGTGCAPAGGQPLAMQPLTRPVLGANFDVAVQNLPAATTLGFFVLSLVQVQPGLDLGGLGAPGCRQYVGLAGAQTDSFVPIGPLGVHSYTIPTNTALSGLPLFVQAAAVVPGVNALGILTADGIDSVLGTL